MKIFITGAGGYIGSHMLRLLLREGCTVHALISQHEPRPWRIEDLLPRLKVVDCDLKEYDELEKNIKAIKPDMAFHLAWYTSKNDYLSSPKNLFHLQAGLQLAMQLASAGCKKFIAAGTCIEYDKEFGYFAESSPKKPENLYAASKLALFLALDQYCKSAGMDFAWTRFFHPYGPLEDEGRLLPMVILSLLRGESVKVSAGEQVRDFIHVEDAVSAVWAVAKSQLTGPVNIGSGQPVTVRETITKIGNLLDKLPLIEFGARPYRPDDPMFLCANNQKLKQNTDWKPRFTLEEGLRDTIEGWKRILLNPTTAQKSSS